MTILAKVQNGTLTLPADAPPLPEGAEVEVSLPEAPAAAPKRGGAMGWMLAYAGTVDDLPEDFADEHDHYIHNTPKWKLNP